MGAAVTVRLLHGDCRDVLKTLPDASVHCCVTSPPYFGLRDYGMAEQIGLESTPDAYVAELVAVFREVRRVLRDDGTLWLNLGDSYAAQRGGTTPPAETLAGGVNGHGDDDAKRGRVSGFNPARHASGIGLKHKDLIGIPWRVAFALQADGWWLRQDIIWHKPNPMPESVTDRCTKAHEYVFLLSKSERYWFDADAIAESAINAGKEVTLGEKSLSKGQANGANVAASGNGKAESVIVKDTRNKRSVWTIATKPYSEAHFATMAPQLAETCILAGCPEGGTVLDPFGGAGTTGLAAERLHCNSILIELNPAYRELAERRITGDAPLFTQIEAAA